MGAKPVWRAAWLFDSVFVGFRSRGRCSPRNDPFRVRAHLPVSRSSEAERSSRDRPLTRISGGMDEGALSGEHCRSAMMS